jgi:hypothetical protein
MVAPGMPAGAARPSIALIPRWARGHAPGWKPKTFTLMNTEQGLPRPLSQRTEDRDGVRLTRPVDGT